MDRAVDSLQKSKKKCGNEAWLQEIFEGVKNEVDFAKSIPVQVMHCLLYTSDAADE